MTCARHKTHALVKNNALEHILVAKRTFWWKKQSLKVYVHWLRVSYKYRVRAHICSQSHFLMNKWNELGFRPPLCTYRLNWARRTSWGWWDDWDDTVLQIQDSKFEPWRSEAEHATSRSRKLPTILTFTRWWGRNIFVSLKPPRPGTEPRTLAWKAAVLTTTLRPPPFWWTKKQSPKVYVHWLDLTM